MFKTKGKANNLRGQDHGQVIGMDNKVCANRSKSFDIMTKTRLEIKKLEIHSISAAVLSRNESKTELQQIRDWSTRGMDDLRTSQFAEC